MGLALSLGEQAAQETEKSLRFFQEVVKTELTRPKPVWASDNKIVYELHTMTLRDFSTPSQNHQIPTLILPPYAGHTSTIADFHQGQSLIGTLLYNGITTLFATEWRSATPSMKDYDIDIYLAELHVVISDLGGRINLIGLCQGGWMASIYAARFPNHIASLVCAGSPLDMDASNGQIRQLANDLPLSFYENMVTAGGGLMKGALMLEGFKGMHPEQQMLDKYVTLYEHIDDPEFVKRNQIFESWYENTIDLPGRWYIQVIKELFKENRFAKGEFIALGKKVKPQSIVCPLYLLAGSTDDITPADQVFNAMHFFGTPSAKIIKELSTGGHIGLFMGFRALKENWPRIAAWLVAQK